MNPEKDTDMGAIALQNEPVILNEIARRLLAEHDDFAKATAAFERIVETDTAVGDAVRKAAIPAYCRFLIRKVAGYDRGTSSGITQSQKTSPLSVVSLQDWGDAISAGMLDAFRLGALPLGDATRPEVRRHSMSYATSAGDAMIKARWLGLIADALPDDATTVRKALTEERVTELRDAARADPWGK